MANKTNMISIKVMVDKVNKRVLYAEADHSFVDILFSFLTLPMGTIVRLLNYNFQVLGSLNNLYQSLNYLPECNFATKECKDMLLNPRSLLYDHCRNLKLKIDDTKPMQYLVCKNSSCPSVGKIMPFNAPTNVVRQCSSCRGFMFIKELYWCADVCAGGGVFVSDTATFIITDDICVEPYTAERSIRLLTDLGITDIDHIEERNLDMSFYQMLSFLKLALLDCCPFSSLVFSEIKLLISDLDFNLGKYVNDLNEKYISASSNMLLQVSLQKSTGKLLFAEAKEDFVEFLFVYLSIPLGSVIKTLEIEASSYVCMNNIYKSILNMSVGRYLKSQNIKDMLLKPHIGQQFSSKNQIFSLDVVPFLLIEEKQKDPRIDGGFLKKSGLFMVTDDFNITPSTSSSTMNILRKLNVSLEDVKRYEVNVGLKEGLSLVRESLGSLSTLVEGLELQSKT